MVGVDTIVGSIEHRMARLVASARERLIIASPFISEEGSRLLMANASVEFVSRGILDLVTDLDAGHVARGSLEPHAVATLLEVSARATLWHVPRLHAKVFVADGCRAIVGSANLTNGGLFRNIEYAVEVTDLELASRIEQDIVDLRGLGAMVSRETLATFSKLALEARRRVAEHASHVEPMVERLMRKASDLVIRARLAGGPMHTVFARTVLYLVERYGPMPTEAIHAMIQSLHPDLCDDTVDRVIAGRRFGKKWKHAVRTAQQQLKRQGRIELVGGLWRSRR